MGAAGDAQARAAVPREVRVLVVCRTLLVGCGGVPCVVAFEGCVVGIGLKTFSMVLEASQHDAGGYIWAVGCCFRCVSCVRLFLCARACS